jgi:hypothetical protein
MMLRWMVTLRLTRRWFARPPLLLVVLIAAAAVRVQSQPEALGNRGTRPFEFGVDTLAFANELAWSYELDPVFGTMRKRPQVPRPSFTLRCFAVARTAKQFYEHARFEPREPKATHASYRHLIRLLKRRSTGAVSPPEQRLVIPGYASLRDFSEDYESLLKAECGPAWRSFVQRGNWRMVFPFSRRHQQGTADRLLQRLVRGRVPAVHVVSFPSLAMNHAVIVFDAEQTKAEIVFKAYDPNDPHSPVCVAYSRRERRFIFPRTRYFEGGPVNVYEIYRGVCY